MPPALPPYFLERIDFTPGCWVWTGPKNDKGYGRAFVQSRLVSAHRFVFERLVRPLSPREDCDHTCPGGPNPLCVNPAHIEPKSRRAHLQRHHPTRTEPGLCKHGHQQSRTTSGKITCRQCGYLRLKAWRERHPDEARSVYRHSARKRRAKATTRTQP